MTLKLGRYSIKLVQTSTSHYGIDHDELKGILGYGTGHALFSCESKGQLALKFVFLTDLVGARQQQQLGVATREAGLSFSLDGNIADTREAGPQIPRPAVCMQQAECAIK